MSWGDVLAWLAPAVAWLKASIAAAHASKTFTLFGLVIDKFDAMLCITVLVTVPVMLAATVVVVRDLFNKTNQRSTTP